MKLVTKSYLSLITILSSIILLSCSGTSPEYRTYQDQLQNQIREMENVLNAGHYREFMATYVNPSYINSMGGLDQALLQFGNSKQQALYAALKISRNIMPLYEEKTKTMTYTTTGLAKPVAFKLINGKWYMQGDDWFR